MPILSVWRGKSFEALAIIVIFRKKKEERKKKEYKKKSEKKSSRVCFSLIYVQPVILLVFWLASLARSTLGPAQYRRWAFIQLCISELIIDDPFLLPYYKPSQLHIHLRRAFDSPW